MNQHINILAKEFKISEKQVEDTIDLIDSGNTIPFIARYRKEVTGNLDDIILRDLDTRLSYIRKLDKRKEEIIANVTEQGKLTPELKAAIEKATILQEVEDLYLPYKQKKKTRASVARAKGLEPLAAMMLGQSLEDTELEEKANEFIDDEKEVATVEEALKGAMDILAEDFSDNANYKKGIRAAVNLRGVIVSSVTKEFAAEKNEFFDYYDYFEQVSVIPNHRILALNRGESRKVLSLKIQVPEIALDLLKKAIVKKPNRKYLTEAVEDSYKRLIFPAIEREVRSELKERAETAAIKTFSINLKKLLLAPPFKEKTTMGFDPAYRTGCKIAVLSPMGELLDTTTIYPTEPHNAVEKSEKVLLGLIDKYKVDIIAIGNGTASRESEQFVAEMIKKANHKVEYLVVNEAGASVYSASELGTKEYPDINVSLRGAISIGGRIQDPLSELVKIDPKHIGVGQYQHDVNQKALEKALDETVEDAVNNVGVNLNRASAYLLQYISGINKTIAENIIAYRETNGKFDNRSELKKVKGLGPKAFEQSAGFLRIDDGKEILDNTGVHPESYKVANALLEKMKITKEDLKANNSTETAVVLEGVDIKETAKELEVGEPTLRDIIAELKKPGRDPRDAAPKPHLKSEVFDLKNLTPGTEVEGSVTNVVDFGAFVDIGVHQDGLVHKSQMPGRRDQHPSQKVAVGDIIAVRVLSVDVQRKRIALTMQSDKKKKA